MSRISNEEIKTEAINIVKTEVETYEDPMFFINEKIALGMRSVIRKCRKNYWGIFDKSPRDRTRNNKEKVWVPATRLIVDSVRKNADMDSKDERIISKNTRGVPIATLIKGFIRKWNHETYFGEALNDLILDLCIDGTAVWKTYTKIKNGKLYIEKKSVDLLNIYIDPTVESIQSAFRFTERALLAPEEVESMDWMDNKEIKGATNLHRNEKNLLSTATTGNYVDVYEMWGMIPEYLITGVKKKKNKMVDGHIIISGIETGDMRVHVIERNTMRDAQGNIIKPYEEARYIKVRGRWYGVGPAEMILQLQEWVNIIVNQRIIKNEKASLGLFSVISGSGITQQKLDNLVSSGVIRVNRHEDIQNMPIAEAGQASYQDEQVAKQWMFEITSTYDTARGAPLPASTTATSAVIEDRNQKTAFILIKESIGLFLQRWRDRHFMVHVPKLMKQEENIILYSDFDEMKKIRESIIATLAIREIENKKGNVPTDDEINEALALAEKKIKSNGNLFFEMVDEIIAKQYSTQIIYTNEEVDVGVTVRNLIDMAGLLQDPQARNDFLAQATELLGLEPPTSIVNTESTQRTEQAIQPIAQGGIPTQLSESIKSNTINAEQT